MDTTVAQHRASMPSGSHKVLDRRSLEKGNELLIPFLKAGMHVLDVGCGSGSITAGIAQRVGSVGKTVGIDTSHELILKAQTAFGSGRALSFEPVSLFDYHPQQQFDLITSARTLQWLSNPVEALTKMKSLLKAGGRIFILDYNHEKINWNPFVPASFTFFYHQFLRWRSDAGMNNRLGDEVAGMMRLIGLKDISQFDASETASSDDPGFRDDAGIWLKVAELRGPQMVEAGFLTEKQLQAAASDYGQWLRGEGGSMTMYLQAVTGVNA